MELTCRTTWEAFRDRDPGCRRVIKVTGTLQGKCKPVRVGIYAKEMLREGACHRAAP